MKKWIPALLGAVLLCTVCCCAAEEEAQPGILAVYSSPEAQIITNDDQSKVLADTVIFLYQDHSYVQYADHFAGQIQAAVARGFPPRKEIDQESGSAADIQQRLIGNVSDP